MDLLWTYQRSEATGGGAAPLRSKSETAVAFLQPTWYRNLQRPELSREHARLRAWAVARPPLRGGLLLPAASRHRLTRDPLIHPARTSRPPPSLSGPPSAGLLRSPIFPATATVETSPCPCHSACPGVYHLPLLPAPSSFLPPWPSLLSSVGAPPAWAHKPSLAIGRHLPGSHPGPSDAGPLVSPYPAPPPLPTL